MVEGPEGPIVVCTRNDALEDVINATPEARRRGEHGIIRRRLALHQTVLDCGLQWLRKITLAADFR